MCMFKQISYGKVCWSNEDIFRNMSDQHVSSWLCSTCKATSIRQLGLSMQESSLERLKVHILDIGDKLAGVLTKVETIEKAMQLQASNMNSMTTKLEQGKTVSDIEKAVDMLLEKYDQVITKI